MKRIFINRKRVVNGIKPVVGIVYLLSLCLMGGSAYAWGPERQTYTNEHPASYATFNSITDNVAVGDERNFVRVREIGTEKPYSDEVEVTPGKEYEVYIYYHNNAASNTNSTGFGMATNSRVATSFPATLNAGSRGTINGVLTWSYVTPEAPNTPKDGKVWDEAYLTSKTDGISMKYKPNSAVIHNGGSANGTILPTALFTEKGTPIGYNKLAGTIPGCAEYSGYITYILVANKTDASLEKKVSLNGENWEENITAQLGQNVSYMATFTNTGSTTLTGIVISDSSSDKLSLVPGSIKVYDAANPNGKAIEDIIATTGYAVGDLAPGASIRVTYQLKVADDADCGANLKNTISVKYNSGEEKTDGANVTVEGDCEPIPPEDCSTNPDLPGCKEDCTTNPNLPECQRIPDTGPVEIILAIIIILGLGGAGYYYYRTQKKVKSVESKVSGKPGKSDKKDATPENPVQIADKDQSPKPENKEPKADK